MLRIPLVDRRQSRASIELLQLGEAEPLRSIGGRALGHRSRHCVAATQSARGWNGDNAPAMMSAPQSSPAPASASVRRSRGRCSPTAGTSSPMSITAETRAGGRGQGRRRSRRPRLCRARSSRPRRACRPCGCSSTTRRASRATIRRVQRRRVRRAHGGQRARAALLIERFARAHDRRRRRLVVNLLDSKLAAPNPDYPELYVVQAGACRIDRACRAGACAAAHPRQWDRARG